MLSIDKLSFGFSGKAALFEELSLSVHPGHVYGLFGLNGAGKTTLLKLMSGLLFPQSGTCELNNVPVQKRAAVTLNDLFYLPEQYELRAIRAYDFVVEYSRFYTGFDHVEFNRIAGLFELDTSQLLTKLSYGQQKKFLIAFAFSCGASLLLLDEPTNGLDIPSKSQFRKVLASSDLEGRSIIISTHQVRDLAQSIDHMLVLDKGRITLNAGIDLLSERFNFGRISESEAKSRGMIYGEEVLGGYKAITLQNDVGAPSEIFDAELLFSAVIANPTAIHEALEEVTV